MKQNKGSISRRQFVKKAGLVAAAGSALPMFGCAADGGKKSMVAAPAVRRGVGPDKPIRIGLIGCGGRGMGATSNAMEADPKAKLVTVADIFPDKLKRVDLKKYNVEVDEKHRFLGFDAYKKVLEQDLDYVILATPPYYRPGHLEACVEAGKNVFMEKPVAVDPVGCRRIMAAGEKAKAKGLSVVAGTQRRHAAAYVETIRRIHDGAIGKIVAAQCYWNTRRLWYKFRQEHWSEDEWMHRDWVNWAWLSGDHIVEQHVHNIDVINWAIGSHPEKVVTMGGRHRRRTGNQYDFFSSDFTYPGEVHVLSQCRQISECTRKIGEGVVGEKGASNCQDMHEAPKDRKLPSPYTQEHADLIAAIRTGRVINESQNVAESTLCGVMARTSAYTGKEVTWDEMMQSDLVLSRPDYVLTEENIRAHIPVPGIQE